MKRLGKVFAVAGSVVLSASLLTAGGGVGAAETDAAAPEWLFATDAADVSITKAGSGFLVSLPVSERVTAFTDRPNRLTDVLTLREFAKDWKAYGFDTDPPNAALLLETGSKTRTSVVEMTNPRIKNGRVTFRLNPIDSSATVAGHTHKHTLKPATYDHAAIFIDDGTNTKMTVTAGNTTQIGQRVMSSINVCGLSSTSSYQWNGGSTQSLENHQCAKSQWININVQDLDLGEMYPMAAIGGDIELEIVDNE